MDADNSTSTNRAKVVVFGAHGWIGGQVLPLLQAATWCSEVIIPSAELRADDDASVRAFLKEQSIGPDDRVLSLLGRTHGEGCATIDYLEQPGKLVENMRDNMYAPAVLACACAELGAHFTYLGTGCIFNDDGKFGEAHLRKQYGPDDLPDFFGSSYSTVKGFTDRLLPLLARTTGARVLNARIRMPITADLHNPRNFITKITRYAKVCSVPNSMSVLPTLLPVLVDLMAHAHVGTVNLVNPGTIEHNEILEMYKRLVDPSFTCTNFTVAEQDAVLAARRSNNQLDTAFLERRYPQVPHIRDAVRACLTETAAFLY